MGDDNGGGGGSTGVVAVLVIFGLCCGWIAMIFGLVGVITCKHPQARQNAVIVLIVSGVSIFLNIVYLIASGGLGGVVFSGDGHGRMTQLRIVQDRVWDMRFDKSW